MTRIIQLVLMLPVSVAAPSGTVHVQRSLTAATDPAPHAAQAGTFRSDHISVVTRGTGPDIILIHGLAGHRDEWAETADALQDRYRLHLVQIHGFGGHPRASTDSLVAAPAAREIARYVREMELTRPALIGHSMGGLIAMMVAARHPDVVGRLLVVDMFPYLAPMGGQPDASPDSLRRIADQMRAQILNTHAGSAGDMIARMLPGQTRRESMRSILVQHANASDRRTVADAMHELVVTDLRPELSNIGVPMTVLYVIPPDAPMSREQYITTVRELYRSARGARLVRIDDSNHFIQLDQPARFVAEVDVFMRGAGGSTPRDGESAYAWDAEAQWVF